MTINKKKNRPSLVIGIILAIFILTSAIPSAPVNAENAGPIVSGGEDGSEATGEWAIGEEGETAVPVPPPAGQVPPATSTGQAATVPKGIGAAATPAGESASKGISGASLGIAAAAAVAVAGIAAIAIGSGGGGGGGGGGKATANH